MSVSIVINRENNIKTSKENPGIKHANFKKYAEVFDILTRGRDTIFVGCSGGSPKPKAAVLTFSSSAEEGGVKKAYILNTDFEDSSGKNIQNIKFEIPKGAKNVSFFEGEMKVLDDAGVRRVVKGSHIYVYEKNDEVFIKVGKSEKAKKKERRRNELAKEGVWRA